MADMSRMKALVSLPLSAHPCPAAAPAQGPHTLCARPARLQPMRAYFIMSRSPKHRPRRSAHPLPYAPNQARPGRPRTGWPCAGRAMARPLPGPSGQSLAASGR